MYEKKNNKCMLQIYIFATLPEPISQKSSKGLQTLPQNLKHIPPSVTMEKIGEGKVLIIISS